MPLLTNLKPAFFFGFGAFFGLTAVLLGAFGAHGLKNSLETEALQAFQTGVEYQQIHALALLLLGILLHLFPFKLINQAGLFIMLGILLFSGSIYAISLSKIIGFSFPRFFYLITPLGGLLFAVGWLLLIIASFQIFKKEYT